jgi:hypothetical protein
MKVLDIPSSGSVNWRTASRNRNGQYIRNRSIPVQPRSTAQLAIRGYLIDAAQFWRTLSDGDRLGWKTYGSLHPKTDSLGQSNAPTGEQVFVGTNAVRALLGQEFVKTAPGLIDFSSFSEGIITSEDNTVVISDYTTPTGGSIMVYAAKPTSPGRSFFGAPLFLLATAIDATAPLDITAQLIGRWGTPADGSKIQITQTPVIGGIKGADEVSEIVFNAGVQVAKPIVTTDFTLSPSTASILFSVTTASIPDGVTQFQFQYHKTGETAWVTTTPTAGTVVGDYHTGIMADALADGSYDVQMRWAVGTIYGLPGAWSETLPVVVT